MTPAELKTYRENLGLSGQWLATKSKVRLRTLQYWESGRHPVPDDVSQFILSLERFSHDQSKLETGPCALRFHDDDDLWRFLPEWRPYPATCHAAMLYRAMSARDMCIVWMEPDLYLAWLGDKPDSREARIEWASQ